MRAPPKRSTFREASNQYVRPTRRMVLRYPPFTAVINALGMIGEYKAVVPVLMSR